MLEGAFLDHIALAVKSLDESQKLYEDLGLVFDGDREEVPSQGVRTAFAALDNRAHLELLEPLAGQDGPIQKFLEKKGEGIHHLCFQVKDVKAKQAELEQKGYKFIYPAAVDGAKNMLVNFMHPKSSKGTLIELAQKKETR